MRSSRGGHAPAARAWQMERTHLIGEGDQRVARHNQSDEIDETRQLRRQRGESLVCNLQAEFKEADALPHGGVDGTAC